MRHFDKFHMYLTHSLKNIVEAKEMVEEMEVVV
jgi:hypothetical protein